MSTVYFKIEYINSGHIWYFKDDIDNLDQYDGNITLVSEDEYLLNKIK